MGKRGLSPRGLETTGKWVTRQTVLVMYYQVANHPDTWWLQTVMSFGIPLFLHVRIQTHRMTWVCPVVWGAQQEELRVEAVSFEGSTGAGGSVAQVAHSHGHLWASPGGA